MNNWERNDELKKLVLELMMENDIKIYNEPYTYARQAAIKVLADRIRTASGCTYETANRHAAQALRSAS